MNRLFWLKNLKRRDHYEDLSIDREITLQWILGKDDAKVWIGCI
jgi:hypothetical protein